MSQLLTLMTRTGRSMTSQRALPSAALKQAGSVHVRDSEERSGFTSKRDCSTVMSLDLPPHDSRIESSGAPSCSTKERIIRSTGCPVTRASSAQKSSPDALRNEYLARYDAIPLRNDSGPTYASTMRRTAAVFSYASRSKTSLISSGVSTLVRNDRVEARVSTASAPCVSFVA